MPTFKDIASEMLSLYKVLLKEKEFEKVKGTNNNFFGSRLKFMEEITDGKISREEMNIKQAIDFYESLLDCVVLRSATNMKTKSAFDSLKIHDPSLLGRARERRASYYKSEEEIKDIQFQLLAHAYLSSKGFGPLTDLKNDPKYKGKKVCEFLINNPLGEIELIECKRIHPNVFLSRIEDILKKIEDIITDAALQLSSTAQLVNNNKIKCKHLLIDISAYNKELKKNSDDLHIEGYDEEIIKKIKEEIKKIDSKGIDKITICYNNIVYIKDKPCAIIQKTEVILFKENAECLFEYNGWTVEGYPKSNSEYAEIRVSTEARSLSWIKTSYNNLKSLDTFYSIGQEERPQQ